LLLVTIGLVLVGFLALVIGFVTNSLGPIYLSIACSIIAGVVLVVFSRMSRKQVTAAASGPAPLAQSGDEAPVEVTSVDAASAVGRDDATQVVPVAVGELTFPIDDYESLRVNEIVPLLGELDLDELDLVREREEQGKNRANLIRRIDERTAELEEEEESLAGAMPASVDANGAAAELVDDEEADEAEADGEALESVGIALDGDASDASLPIAGYSTMTVSQILPMLDDLSDDDLETIAEHEERTRNRGGIISRIDAIFEGAPPLASAPAAKKAPGKKAAAKKASAKKAVVKKAPTKRAVVTKTATKRAPAKKAATAKAAASRKAAAPRKAAATTKAAAKKTAAKKTAATKVTAKKAVKRR
jgi:hypothetical protein